MSQLPRENVHRLIRNADITVDAEAIGLIQELAWFWLECDGQHTINPNIVGRLRVLEGLCIPDVSEADPMAQHPALLTGLELSVTILGNQIDALGKRVGSIEQESIGGRFSYLYKAVAELQKAKKPKSPKRRSR